MDTNNPIDHLPSFVLFAEELADTARTSIMRHFQQAIDIQIKPDQSPVTRADQETETLLRDAIHARFPAHKIIGEEHGTINADTTSRWQWTLDPIDGTQSFVCGVPLFGSLISLQCDATPVIGVIDMPALQSRFVGSYAAEQDHYHGYHIDRDLERHPLATSQTTDLSQARLMAAHPDMFDAQTWPAFQRLSQACQITRYSADCYAYALLSIGAIEIVAEADMKPHDYRALIPVIKAAGGVITDWQGKSLDDQDGVSTVLACANAALHDQVLALLNDNRQ